MKFKALLITGLDHNYRISLSTLMVSVQTADILNLVFHNTHEH